MECLTNLHLSLSLSLSLSRYFEPNLGYKDIKLISERERARARASEQKRETMRVCVCSGPPSERNWCLLVPSRQLSVLLGVSQDPRSRNPLHPGLNLRAQVTGESQESVRLRKIIAFKGTLRTYGITFM